MNCPACKIGSESSPSLQQKELEPGLSALSCGSCSGVFLEHLQYSEWAESAGHAQKGDESSAKIMASTERVGAKFCPACKAYLVKYDVASDVPFTVDRCGQCGGIWLDGNEWEQLKSRSLHRDLHRIFSTDWQSKVRTQEHESALKQIWREQFGAADFDELQRIKNWIDSHPKAPEIYAFLHSARADKSHVKSSVS